MPFEKAHGDQQYHRARIRPPDDFKPDGMKNGETFATEDFGDGVLAILGVPKGKEKTAVQSLRFDKEKFTMRKAREWMRKNGYRAMAADEDLKFSDGEALLGPIECLRTGHIPELEGTGLNPITEKHLEQLAADYNPELFEAPVTLDHKQDGEALGWVTKLVKIGKSLFAYAKDVQPELREMLKSKRYKKVSIEMRAAFHKTGRPYFRALSFLGAAKPACVGMADVQQTAEGLLMSFTDKQGDKCLATPGLELNAYPSMAGSMPMEIDFDNFDLLEVIEQKEVTKNLNDLMNVFDNAVYALLGSDRTDKSEVLADLLHQFLDAIEQSAGSDNDLQSKGDLKMSGTQTPTPGDPKVPAPPPTPPGVDADKLAIELKARDEKIRQLEAEQVALKVKAKLGEIDLCLSALVKEGKVLPKWRTDLGLDEFLAALPEVELPIGGKPTTLRKFAEAFLKELPVQVKFGTSAPSKDDRTVSLSATMEQEMPKGVDPQLVDQRSLELSARAREIANKEKISYGDALVKAAKENPALVNA